MDSCTSSDEEEVQSFVKVLSEKYHPENFPYGQGVMVLPSPPGSPVKDRLYLPSILVLNYCGIRRAGDRSDIAAFCAHVVELDLSHNELNDWEEVCTIASNIPQLDFLNLSMNPLRGVELKSNMAADVFCRLRQLVLINTHVSWDTVHTLTQHTPELEELFLCLNGYNSVAESEGVCPSLRLLQITDNQLCDWSEVRKLGVTYPGLSTLILANNSVSSVEDSEETIRRLFPNLRYINLSNSGLSQWEDISRLNFFPKLEEVKAMGIPLVQPYSTQERRNLLLAQLPSIGVLNGGMVSSGEREDAERFFIRFYQDNPQPQLQQRYHALVSMYGPLEPLAEVDLSPRSPRVEARYHALVSMYGPLEPLAEVDLSPRPPRVEVRFGESAQTLCLTLEQTVAELKRLLKSLLQINGQAIRLFYINTEMIGVLGPEEMRFGTRALHSYRIQDGDQIVVVPRQKSPNSSSQSSTDL